MVSGKRIGIILLTVTTRIFLFVAVLVMSLYLSPPFEDLNRIVFDYRKPSGFFGFTLSEAFLALTLSLTLWSGIIFGAIGRKIDYVFIGLVFVLAFWEYSSAENVTPQMYLGLIGVAVLGNFLGYLLKLARQRWLPGVWGS